MAAPLIAIFGIGYLVISIDLLHKGQMGLGIAFFGYAIGNVGLYIAAKGGM
jgi:hypothetical protein